MIVLGTSVLGFSASQKNYKRHKNLVNFLTGLNAMENEIRYTKKVQLNRFQVSDSKCNLVKREVGVSPARTRHCNKLIYTMYKQPLTVKLGRR